MSSDKDFYEQALDEFENEKKVKSIDAKALIKANEEKQDHKAIYIKMRVSQLEEEKEKKEKEKEKEKKKNKNNSGALPLIIFLLVAIIAMAWMIKQQS